MLKIWKCHLFRQRPDECNYAIWLYHFLIFFVFSCEFLQISNANTDAFLLCREHRFICVSVSLHFLFLSHYSLRKLTW